MIHKQANATLPQSGPPSGVVQGMSETAARGTRPKRRRFVRRIVQMLPTVGLLILLAGVGWAGHHFGWKLPKFSEMTTHDGSPSQNWCEEHGVPEKTCVACNPEIMPAQADYGWCSDHGVHNCTLHHPDVAQTKTMPAVSQDDFIRAEDALALRDRPANNAACSVYQQRIQFASIKAVQQAGVDVELVDRQPITETVTGNGEIRYDATRLARLSSRVNGTAWRVLKNIGDRVEEGEVLAVVDAMEVGRLKGELVQALVEEKLARQNVDRLTGLQDGVVPGKVILEKKAALSQAEAVVLSAEQALANRGLSVDVAHLRDLPQQDIIDRVRFLGLPEDLAQQFKSQTSTANLIPIRSPMDGVIVQRTVVAGEMVDSAKTLFEVADPSQMWLMLNTPLEDADLLAVGQTVRFLPNGSEREVVGQLSWISTAVDKQTRMVKVRANLDNADGRLRDETFGTGEIVLREEPNAIVVPTQAIHWEGCCHVVFVRNRDYFKSPESPKLFHLRSVRMGASNGEFTEIIAGLLPGEVVATEGSDVLRAQLLKNNLGAGCCAE